MFSFMSDNARRSFHYLNAIIWDITRWPVCNFVLWMFIPYSNLHTTVIVKTSVFVSKVAQMICVLQLQISMNKHEILNVSCASYP